MSTRRSLFHRSILSLAALSAAASLPGAAARAADPRWRVPAPLTDEPPTGTGSRTLVLAGGCFWGVQGVFQHVRGVTGAVSGYDGGAADTARYETVSTGTTGHAESVRITYDPRIVTAGVLLRIFFSVVTDPTQRDRQYPDRGPQYRSAVFATSPEQARVARAYIAQLDAARTFQGPIVTQVVKDGGFHPAEGYHQNYLTLHPDSSYIATFDLPKVAALQRAFPDSFRPDPVLVAARRS